MFFSTQYQVVTFFQLFWQKFPLRCRGGAGGAADALAVETVALDTVP